MADIIYGLTPQGFVLKPQQVILDEMEAEQLATIDPALDVSSDQEIGQLNGIMSRTFAKLWELLQSVYKTFDRDAAEGEALVQLGKLTGSIKNAATKATIKATLVFSKTATLENGTHFVALESDSSIRFTPTLASTTYTAGTYTNVAFIAETAGVLVAPAGDVNAILTAVDGWDSCVSTSDATGGLPADGDPELRTSMALDVVATGASTIDAIVADVLALNKTQSGNPSFTTIQTCKGFENRNDVTDGDGLPPHSFEILVYDGDTPGADNADLIAQAIWDSKPAGIASFGQLQGNAVDKLGVSHTVFFTRVAAKLVYLIYDLDHDSSPPYVGPTVFKEQIVGLANELYKVPGSTVIAERVKALAFTQAGVTDVPAFTLGFAPSPVGTTNLAIGSREVARFDTSRVSVI